MFENSYNQSGKQGRLETSRVRQRELGGEQSRLEQEQEEVSANINKMRKILATQQVRSMNDSKKKMEHWRLGKPEVLGN